MRFDQLIGQSRVVSFLKQEAAHARQTGNTVPHVLLFGPPGLGKTTIAECLATECGAQFLKWQAGKLLTPKEIARRLMDLDVSGYSKLGQPLGASAARYVVLLDECHLLTDFDQWHPVLSSQELNPDPHGGVSWLPMLTVVAATNFPNRLPAPFKSRFTQLRVEPYNVDDLSKIARLADPKLGEAEARDIANRARGSARLAKDYAALYARYGTAAFSTLEVDGRGLRPIDRSYLDCLGRSNRPLSLNTIAGMIQEDPNVVRSEIEPYLLQLGLIEITSKGRILVGNVLGSRGGRVTGAMAV